MHVFFQRKYRLILRQTYQRLQRWCTEAGQAAPRDSPSLLVWSVRCRWKLGLWGVKRWKVEAPLSSGPTSNDCDSRAAGNSSLIKVERSWRKEAKKVKRGRRGGGNQWDVLVDRDELSLLARAYLKKTWWHPNTNPQTCSTWIWDVQFLPNEKLYSLAQHNAGA